MHQIQEKERTNPSSSEIPQVAPADIRKSPPSVDQVMLKLQQATNVCPSTQNWDWTSPQRKPLPWPGDEVWKKLFGELGFCVMVIAYGSELEKMQLALETQWLVGCKETIRNMRTVWMECDDGAKPEWISVEEDAGRLMVWLNQQTHLPDIDIVKDHYPTG